MVLRARAINAGSDSATSHNPEERRVSSKPEHEEHEGNEGHEEKQKALTTDRTDEGGSERIATARKAINEAASLRDGIGPRSERSVRIRSHPFNPFFQSLWSPAR
jgi:hypothetical protein